MNSNASRCFVFLCLLSFGLSESAGGEPSDGERASPPTPSTSAPRSEAELIEQLSAVGYLAATEQAGDSQGVTLHDPRRSAQGLNLITSGHGPVALLMDMDGTVLHEWRAEFAQVFPEHPRSERAKEPRRNFWRDTLLFPNGDIVVIWELFGLFKLDRDSRLLWSVPEPAHHDLQLTESGEIIHLQSKRKMIPGIEKKPAIEDFIIVRDGSGEELRRLAMSDALRNVDWLRLRRSFWARARERGYGLNENTVFDPFHTNSLWLLSTAEAARLGDSFQAGDALVSMGMLDTVAILDMEKGVTRWSQQGPFGMQHSPRLTADGGIILFNNFLTAERSSVLTLDPRTRRVIREYTGPKSEPLYSRRSGRVQMLPNGNTLVVETDGGRALELTEDREVVWEFRSPYRVREGVEKVANLYSLKRVDEGQAAWLTSKKPSGIKD
ncbi:MAG: hypothetical protein HRU02_11835 [Myxococcales bacterium]|nr:hypothetical protein [Myxococcales bacterium]